MDGSERLRVERFDCPSCGCYFFSRADLRSHKLTHSESREGEWQKSRFDSGEICRYTCDPYLVKVIKQSGPVTIGCFKYSLSENGEWLKRKNVPLR